MVGMMIAQFKTVCGWSSGGRLRWRCLFWCGCVNVTPLIQFFSWCVCGSGLLSCHVTALSQWQSCVNPLLMWQISGFLKSRCQPDWTTSTQTDYIYHATKWLTHMALLVLTTVHFQKHDGIMALYGVFLCVCVFPCDTKRTVCFSRCLWVFLTAALIRLLLNCSSVSHFSSWFGLWMQRCRDDDVLQKPVAF